MIAILKRYTIFVWLISFAGILFGFLAGHLIIGIVSLLVCVVVSFMPNNYLDLHDIL